MKIEKLIENLPYFSTQSLATIMQTDTNTAKSTLFRLVKQNRVVRLKKGLYMNHDFVLRYSQKPYFINLVSNIINPFSYLSLTYVMQGHNILTEGTYTISGITTKNTSRFQNKFGAFHYSHIKDELYTGFLTQEHHNIKCHFATKAKALFDFLYLRPLTLERQIKDYDLAKELRLNLDQFSVSDRQEFEEYCLSINSPKMEYVLENIKKNVWLLS